jgi:hypothetical protein
MTLFDERERAFEEMFVHDEETRFRALARRNKLLGLWAAEQIGLSGEKAFLYADEIRQSGVAAQADAQLLQKIQTDFEVNGVDPSEDRIREKMGELMARAIMEVRSDTRSPG